jgi:AcrR family transcriptional regulator
MVKTKTDRRVKYTKLVLRETMIKLLKTNHVSKISIKKLCEIADVNRSTFYTYYKNPYDLLFQIEHETIKDINQFILKKSLQSDTPYKSLCILLEYVAQNNELFQILLNEKRESSFRKEILKLVRKLALIEIPDKTHAHEIEYLQIFLITGCISIVDKWLKDGMREQISEIAELILFIFMKIGNSDFQKRKL